VEDAEVFPEEVVNWKKLLSLLGDGWLHVQKIEDSAAKVEPERSWSLIFP